MKITRFIVLILTFIGWSSSIWAQQYNFVQYNLESGLPQSNVFGILQDSRGYLWLGTEGGLARFDGIDYVVYDKNSGLPSNTVRCIIETNYGNIWAGTDNGLAYFNGTTWQIVQNTFKGTSVLKLAVDEQNRIWAATNDNGINILSVDGDSLDIKNMNSEDGLTGEFVLDIFPAPNNETYVATIGGLSKVIFHDTTPEIIDFGNQIGLPAMQISCIEGDIKNNLYIGTLDAGAFQWNSNTKKLFNYGNENKIPDTKIWDILADPDGGIWFATNSSGVFYQKNEQLIPINIQNGLPANLILTVYRDHNQNVWMGTWGQGFVLFRGFQMVHYSLAKTMGITQVLTVTTDNNNHLWIGGNQNKLVKASVDNESITFESFNPRNAKTSGEITSIAINKKGEVIAGTQGNGIMFYNGKLFDFLTTRDGLLHNNINTICISGKGTIYAGTDLGFNEITSNKIHAITEENGLINPEIQTIIADKTGNIWMGTYGGLVQFQPDNQVYRDFDQQEGLFDLSVRTLAVDAANLIWIGTPNGIYTYFPQTDTIIGFTKTTLNSKMINSLLFENDSTLYVGTTNGFNKLVFDYSFNKVLSNISYDKTNGFSSAETNKNAICHDALNQIWFGTVAGITCYRPFWEDTSTFTPTVLLSGIRLSFENVNWESKGFKTNQWNGIPTNLKLKYTDNHLSFDFRGIYLKQPEKVVYRYKLEPFEKQWSPISKQNFVTYPGLSDNNYTFSLIASHDGIHWSKPLQYSFIISPPFWKRVWFYLLLFVVASTLITFYIRWREKKLVKEKEHLEQVVKERTAEVVAQKEEIEKQKEEITDSITYAKRIQQAVLPGNLVLEQHTSDCFILYKPRDIVSGDFYWIDGNNNYLVVAAADCTGHGVPGAFMSMLGVSFMNKIIKEQKITNPDKILEQMRHNVITSLKQGDYEGSSKDGMDMALCVINLETLTLTFSGAYNPAIIISDGEATELKADRMPVGYHIVMHEYTPVTFQLKKGDCIYLFSDGYQDQMGGPDGRKFMRKNLREFLVSIHAKSFSEQRELLDSNIENWRNHPSKRIDQMDDILVIGFKV